MNVSFREALTNGIRRDDRLPRNNKFLNACRNAASTEFGVRPLRDLVQPITDADLTTATITKSHPFPQLFRMKSWAFLLDEDAVFNVTESAASSWSISASSVYDLSTYNWSDDTASTYSIDGGKDWHVADIQGGGIFCNGVDTLFFPGFSTKMFGQKDVTIRTCATFNDGRLFLGGFDSDDIYSLVDWPTIYADHRGDFPSDFSRILGFEASENWVWFSDIGMSNILNFFSEDYMKYMSLATTPETEYNDDYPFWKEVLLKRESFFMPMPSSGAVVRMMQLGNCMVVYSTDGVHTLVPYNDELVKTFGHREVSNYGYRMGVKQGTLTRAAAGGNEQVQAFIAENNDLFILSPDGPGAKAEYLGYRHIFNVDDNWLVHFDPSEQEFHFSATGRAYRLRADGNGLVRAPQIPTTVFFGRVSNTSAPIGILTADASPTQVVVRTDWFDAGPTIKVPELDKIVLNCGETLASGWTASLEYRLSENNTKTVTVAKTADPRGNIQFDVSGMVFRLTLTHSDRTVATLENLEAVFGDGTRRNLDTWRL